MRAARFEGFQCALRGRPSELVTGRQAGSWRTARRVGAGRVCEEIAEVGGYTEVRRASSVVVEPIEAAMRQAEVRSRERGLVTSAAALIAQSISGGPLGFSALLIALKGRDPKNA